jgi:thiamine-phosphate pyrophosphorylase
MSGVRNFRSNNICFITPLGGNEGIVLEALESGIRWIQYREKNRSKREIFYQAVKLREITRRFDACFVVNDYVDIAIAVDADGIHIGQDDLPIAETRRIMGYTKIVGVSTHTLREAMEAEKGGADYIGFGPVFYTATKDAGEPKGVDVLRKIKDSVKIPVIAIGGIKTDNVKSVFDAGCDGAAVSSGILEGNTRENVRIFCLAGKTGRLEKRN